MSTTHRRDFTKKLLEKTISDLILTISDLIFSKSRIVLRLQSP